jgi:DNA-binding transcriptional regulator LsrR (DeoR family)
VRKLAELYGGEAFYLNAPLFVEDEYVKSVISADPLKPGCWKWQLLGVDLTGVSAFRRQADDGNPCLAILTAHC